MRFKQADEPERTVTLVNFMNNSPSDPEHFWLGVSERDLALENALDRTIPFLGRIHWEMLAPHERGMHSIMYVWPLEDGRTWGGNVFGHEWHQLSATARPDGAFDIRGVGEGSARITYDYVPSMRWFSTLRIVDGDGSTRFAADVIDHADGGATGTFHFLRGRPYLESGGGSLGSEVNFEVRDEGLTSLVLRFDVQSAGPGAIVVHDPSGEIVHREAVLPGAGYRAQVELDGVPAPGDWTLRYLGDFSGSVTAHGIIEYNATL